VCCTAGGSPGGVAMCSIIERSCGRLCAYQKGNVNNKPTASACTPKDARVIQPRRERLFEADSHKESANVASSRDVSCYLYGHRLTILSANFPGKCKEKRPREGTAWWNSRNGSGVANSLGRSATLRLGGRCGRLSSRRTTRLGAGRPWGPWSRRRHARLGIVSVHHRFSDV
jgi:hypothetical protein